MAYDDPTIARVCKNGYRILAPLEPGLRTHTPDAGRPAPPTAKPLDVPASIRAPRARRVAGYTS